jgi:type IV secretory pathway TraG/TraD family ATPase VirD4
MRVSQSLRLSVLLVCVAAGGLIAHAQPAQADSVADLARPSSSIPGCVNVWTSGYTGETSCEARATDQQWRSWQATIATASAVIMTAAHAPEHADPSAVISALQTLAVMADAVTAQYHPGPKDPDILGATLRWMHARFAAFHLPRPARLGDGFRTLAENLSQPHLGVIARGLVYDRSTALADALMEAVRDDKAAAVEATNTAVYQTHRAAMQAAEAAESGTFNAAHATAAIAAAAGPDHTAIAAAETRILLASVAHHPNQAHYLARTHRRLAEIPNGLLGLIGVGLLLMVIGLARTVPVYGLRRAVAGSLMVIAVAAASWLPMILLLSLGLLPNGIVPGLVWLICIGLVLRYGRWLLPRWFRAAWSVVFGGKAPPETHGSARFGTVGEATAGHHLAPDAQRDAFALGWLHGTGHLPDGRFWQDGHILTCAPTGAGKGIGAVIPNLLAYPGSAFVLDFKGENYAVTARARRAAGQDVFLIDPFGITGAPSHGMNWLDALDPEAPDVVSLASAMAEMLVVSTGAESDPHWTESGREFLRGLLIYVAGLSGERRSMSALRAILTGSEEAWAETLADMLSDPLRGHRIVARTATSYLNRPEKERGSILSTVVRQTAWFDDPRLAQAFDRHDFDLRDLKRRPMTVYLAIPPDRLRACLGFVRGFIGLALDAMTVTQGRPEHRVAFILDEFGQLGRMDSLADSITLLRGYGAQFWLFVQDLSQLKAVYPRWQSFLANTTQQFFGTADFDTARYLSEALGQVTIGFETRSRSTSTGLAAWSGQGSVSATEHRQGRSLLTPDEIMRLGPTRPIVLRAGEAPYLLERLNYLSDAPYAGQFDPNPMHAAETVK